MTREGGREGAFSSPEPTVMSSSGGGAVYDVPPRPNPNTFTTWNACATYQVRPSQMILLYRFFILFYRDYFFDLLLASFFVSIYLHKYDVIDVFVVDFISCYHSLAE